jgi:hypothetical protein
VVWETQTIATRNQDRNCAQTHLEDISDRGKEKDIKPIHDHGDVVIPDLRTTEMLQIRFKLLVEIFPLLT